MAAQPGHLTWMKYVFSCPKSIEYLYLFIAEIRRGETVFASKNETQQAGFNGCKTRLLIFNVRCLYYMTRCPCAAL